MHTRQDGSSPQLLRDRRTRTTRLLKYTDLEEWRRDNSHIHRGYHPLTNSWRKSWLTLLGPAHTETVNILTHLLGALAVAFCFVYTYKHLASPTWYVNNVKITPVQFFVFTVMRTAAYIDWIYRVGPNQAVAESFNRLDYVGIVFLITGTYYPALYYGFYCEPIWQIIYMLGVTAFGATTAYFVLSPGYATAEYRRIRTFLFIGLGLSGIVPVAHKMLQHGYAHARDALGLDWLIVGGALYIGGALLYAERIPERFYPGKFDIYGNSHQIFHVACLLAALAHYVAICHAHDYHHYVSPSSCSLYRDLLQKWS